MPKGWRYLLTKRVALRVLNSLELDNFTVRCTGTSYSEKPDLTWLSHRVSKRFSFGSATLIRNEGERDLYVDLDGLKVLTIGGDKDAILESVLKRFTDWIEDNPRLLSTAPRDKSRFGFEFKRIIENGELVLQDA